VSNSKVEFFPDIVFRFLVGLGVLALLDEAWRSAEPPWLVRFIQALGLWNVWEQLRWEHMYSHEVLHFLSGLFGSMLGCWIYFAYQKKKALASPIAKDDQARQR
jgi:hypothetical protein